MRLIQCILLVLFTSCTTAFSQPLIEWQKKLGGSDLDEGTTIRQTSDGGFVFVGTTASSDGDVVGIHGLYDAWVVKLSSSGSIEWKKSLGGSASDAATSIRQTSDGGYIIAGNTMSNNGDVTGNHGMHDAWIVKLSADGNIVWQKTLGGPRNDMAYSVEQTFDGGYIVAGSSDSAGGDVAFNHGQEDFWVVKLSSAGSIQWEHSYGGSNRDIAAVVIQTADSGYLVGGGTQSSDGDVTFNHGNKDVWLVKITATGNMSWQRTYGGSVNDLCGWEDNPGGLKQTSDGGYIFAGWTNSLDGDVTFNHGDYDMWVVKLFPTGAIDWQYTYGGSLDDQSSSIQQTADGGYIVAGVEESTDGNVTGNHGGYDYWLVKLNSAGILQWQKAMGGSALYLGDCAFSVQQTSDLGYIVGGYSLSTDGDAPGGHGDYDFWAVKVLCSSPIVGPSALCMGDTVQLTNLSVGGTWSASNGNATVAGGRVIGVSGGTTTISYVTANICGLSTPMKVMTVHASPSPVIVSGDLTMSTSVPFVSYQWISSTGPIVGANGPSFTAAGYGFTYRVYVTDTNGCSDTSANYTIWPTGVGTFDPHVPGIYPNPASTAIFVSGVSRPRVKIFNAMGQLVKEMNKSTNIDIADMAAGCYLVQIWNERGEVVCRTSFMKQ